MTTTPDHLTAVLGRDFFPALTERRQACTRPPADAPTMVDVVRSFVLLDVDLLVNAAGETGAVLQDWSGRG